MRTISRTDLRIGLITVNGIQSATWTRKVAKKQDGSIVSKSGNKVTMQFITKFNRKGTKNWEPSGGNIFNVASKKSASDILRKNNLIVVLKMSETGTDDVRAVPRVIPIDRITRWKAEGKTYKVID